ncbi:hypothetical protein WR25_25270 [Diploscapter pachys]|uniref:LPS-assembly lipoprotein LptE n=1 Tax=Diploscapter pachys TaxID=2018661 RepID=A0A2A2M554_9BILA|nr:hypothetical protein WR25_25270 [Diploscapter pachys]
MARPLPNCALVLTNEQESQRAATYTGGSRSAEYELTTVLNYTVEGQNDTVLLEDKLQVQKYYVYDGNNINGSGQEAVQVRQEMRRDLVQGMMVRLQQLTPVRLQDLQHKADERAKAEARALQEAQRIQDETPQQSPLEVPAP